MRKLSYNYVKSQFEKEGYGLLSKEYINSKTKLSYICKNGHRHNITWCAWKQGQRCLYCSGKAKLKILFIKLVVHHIDYNKKNCKPYNLITLCNSCNSRANNNRKQHEKFYKSIMEEYSNCWNLKQTYLTSQSS